jgi:hypothetical protein
MCTVSVIYTGERIDRAVRVVCNRDELRTRAEALPPRVCTLGERRAVMPIDPVSGGTWIAASDARIVMALLNYNPRPARTIGVTDAVPRSRGTIIPSLLQSSSMDEAVEAALHLRAREYEPFRLVILDVHSICEVVSDVAALRTFRTMTDGRPLLFTSSGLGDEQVDRPRRELFEQLIPPYFATAAAQDVFHRHMWEGREHISVLMSRVDARTVSRTTVELSRGGARMKYEPVPIDETTWPDRPGHAHASSLAGLI